MAVSDDLLIQTGGNDMQELDFHPDARFYHGSADPLSATVLPGAETRWWNPMDHEQFLDPPWDDDDAEYNGELAAELRTAYANIVYETFLSSDDPEMRMMAETHGIAGLGSEVGILFVADNPAYVERYGRPYEIDIEAEGVLDMIFDENASVASWMLVMRAGAPFPLKSVTPTPGPLKGQ